MEGSELPRSTEQSVQNEGGSQDDNNLEKLPDTCGPEADAQRLLLKQLTEIYDRVTADCLTITKVQMAYDNAGLLAAFITFFMSNNAGG